MSAPDRSLFQPEGQWFQLQVAGAIQRLGGIVELEQRSDGSNPKDIILPNWKSQIECKAFRRAHAFSELWNYHAQCFDVIEAALPPNNGKLDFNFEWAERPLRQQALDVLRRMFLVETVPVAFEGPLISFSQSDHKSELTGKWEHEGKMIIFGTGEKLPLHRFPFSMCTSVRSSVIMEGPKLNDFRRVYDAITEKRRQMHPDWINIVALDVADLGGPVHDFESRLLQTFSDEQVLEISALLFINQSNVQHFTSVKSTLALNPIAAVPVPAEMIRELEGNVYWA